MSTRRLGRVVIVGGGIAGLTAGETLRAHGYDGELVVVGDEPYPAYSRPALSKALLHDLGDVSSHRLPEPEIDATMRLGVRASGLDPERRVVVLDGGEELPYDGLVIATGTRARRLGPEGCGELTLRGLDDALSLRERLAGRPSVLVVGAGPLGMEIASGCLDAGADVTVVSQGAPLSRQLGDYLSALLVRAAEARGLRILETAGARVLSGTEVLTAEGERLAADLVVTAAGDAPHTEWLAGSGLPVDGRLVVDSRGRVPGCAEVVAAGDVAAVPTKQGVRRVPFWTSAIDQAKAAGAALLLGDDAPELTLQPYFWTEQFGLSLKVCGDLVLEGEPELVDGDPEAGSMLLRWPQPDGTATAVAVNYRIPVPRLRRMTRPGADAPLRAIALA